MRFTWAPLAPRAQEMIGGRGGMWAMGGRVQRRGDGELVRSDARRRCLSERRAGGRDGAGQIRHAGAEPPPPLAGAVSTSAVARLAHGSELYHGGDGTREG